MKKIVLVILFISSFCFSQIEKKLGDFHKITAFDKIDIALIKSSERKIIITGNYANEVELINKKGELKIRLPFTKILQGDNISVTLYCNNIEALEVNEGARIASQDIFNTLNFEIIAKEGGEINVGIKTDRLKAKILQGSIVTLFGKAQHSDILVNSGSEYNAEEIKTKQTIITANMAGKASVCASNYVEAKVRAGGEITIYGKPQQINKKIIAGGTIKQAQ